MEVVMCDGRWAVEITQWTGNEGEGLRMVGGLTRMLLNIVGGHGEEVDERLGEDGEVVMGDGR
jgi:hypothetical protein